MKFFEQLDVIIESVISEMVDDERKKQQALSSKIDKLGLRAADESSKNVDEAEDEKDEADEEEEPKLKGDAAEEEKGKDTDEPGTATSKKLKDPSTKQLKKPSFKAIANNINLLRGGKSIKDPAVRKNLQDYLDKLSTDEKRDVLIYLNSLAQVMAGVVSGAEAELPAAADEKIDKKEEREQKTDSGKRDSAVIVVGGD